MKKKLSNEEIDKRIFELTSEEYVRIGEYKGSSSKMLIKHNVCENEYEVRWNQFEQGSRCPKCIFLNRFLDNDEIDKEIMELTDGEYVRLGEYKSAKDKILLLHTACNSKYEVTWSRFKSGNRCPKCAKKEMGKKRRLNNVIVDNRILELVGNEYIRLGKYIKNDVKMLIKHNVCENEYEVEWNAFKKGNRCPFCSKRTMVDNKKIDKRIFKLVGDEYIRLSEYKNAKTKILMKHNTCGNKYKVTWGNFASGCRCPFCNESKGEKEISNILSSLNVKYTSQKRFPECKYKKTLPFDFYISNKKSKLLIEFDGRQHFESVDAWGGEESFRETQFRDQIKTKFALSKNIPLLRIPYTEQDNIEQILTNKLKELNFI